jgi:hypothetical protein
VSTILINSPKLGLWAAPQVPSLGASHLSRLLDDKLKKMRTPALFPSQIGMVPPQVPTAIELADRLFTLSSRLKILVSQVSMHLPDVWRRRLFGKLDQLNDPENWEASDVLVDPASFMTFLRLILQMGPVSQMHLGVSPDGGRLLVGWLKEKDTLSLEFLPYDEIRWSLVRHLGEKTETAAGRTNLERLPAVLAPYNPEAWFDNGDPVSA